jgi:hypothetical protein
MKTKIWILVGCSVLGGSAGHAAPDAGGAVPPYELRRRSVCELPDGFRSPFLPPGWKRPVEPGVVPGPVAVASFSEKDFQLTSVLLGSPSLAVINGRSYSEGEYMKMPVAQRGLGRVQVVKIGDGSAVLQAGGRPLTIRQRRSDLPAGRPELELINPDR